MGMFLGIILTGGRYLRYLPDLIKLGVEVVKLYQKWSKKRGLQIEKIPVSNDTSDFEAML